MSQKWTWPAECLCREIKTLIEQGEVAQPGGGITLYSTAQQLLDKALEVKHNRRPASVFGNVEYRMLHEVLSTRRQTLAIATVIPLLEKFKLVWQRLEQTGPLTAEEIEQLTAMAKMFKDISELYETQANRDNVRHHIRALSRR
jgi:hypothetical protein